MMIITIAQLAYQAYWKTVNYRQICNRESMFVCPFHIRDMEKENNTIQDIFYELCQASGRHSGNFSLITYCYDYDLIV